MAHTVVAFGVGLKRWPACSLIRLPLQWRLGPALAKVGPPHSGASTLARRLSRVLTPACIDSRVRRLAPHQCSQPRRPSQGCHGPWGAQVRSPVLTIFPLLPLGLPLASWVASRVQTPQPQPQPTTDDDGRWTNDGRTTQKTTKYKLLTHPLATQLQSCDSPADILSVLQDLVQQFDQSSSSDQGLSSWLGPTVNVLFAFSAALGEGVGLVRFLSLSHETLGSDLVLQVFSPAKVVFAGIGNYGQ